MIEAIRDQWISDARILIVDDEPNNVEYLERVLTEHGFNNLVSIIDPRHFSIIFQSFAPDLILLDWLMPHLDGEALLKMMPALLPGQTYLPVLVITADSMPETRQRALSIGAKDFLTKPFDMAEVLLRIRNLLETRCLHIQLTEHIAQLEEAQAEAGHALIYERELNEMKNRFISMTSHEFRTPLSTILSSAELLEHYGQRWPREKQLAHVRRIQQSVHQMTGLLEEVLFIGRADAQRLAVSPAAIDLREFCIELIDEHLPTIDSSFQLRLFIEGEPEMAFIDARLLRQVLGNLISNAIKYMPQGGTAVLTLRFEPENRVLFSIADTGIGIPPEAMPHLYEVFHRASNAESIPGHGLGLAIVKRAIDLLGGAIQCESTLGRGTTFTVSLPLRPVVRATSAVSSQ